MTYTTLFQALQSAGLRPDAEVPPLPPRSPHAPWIARILLGVCGWIAGILALSALGAIIVGLFQSAAALFVVAAAAIVAAAALYRAAPFNELGLQFALATSIAGQLAFAAALTESGARATASIAMAIAILQVVLIALMPNALHRFLSALFAVIALGVAAHEWHGPMFFAALVSSALAVIWIAEARWQCAGAAELLRPVAYALGLAVLGLPLAQPEVLFAAKSAVVRAEWSSAIAFVPALALAAWSLAGRAAAAVRAAAAAACVGLIVLAAYAPGISAALLVTALAFAAGARTLVGTAILVVVVYIGVFYYSLQATLLAKSIALAAAGSGCLTAMLVVRRLQGSARA